MKHHRFQLRLAIIIFILSLVVFILSIINAGAQDYRASLSGVYAPQDRAIGIKAGYNFGMYGLYFSYSHGNYFGFDYQDQPFYIKNHNRWSGGFMIFSGTSYLSVGLVRHSFGDMDNTGFLNPRAFERVSAEFGVGCCINRFISGFRFDPFKWTGRVEVGIRILKIKQ